MYSAFDHWAYWSHMLTVISMFSPCTQWVFGPLSPVPVGQVCILVEESRLIDRRILVQSQMVTTSRLIPSLPTPSSVSVVTQTIVRTYADASVEALNVCCMPWAEFHQKMRELVQENALTRIYALLWEMQSVIALFFTLIFRLFSQPCHSYTRSPLSPFPCYPCFPPCFHAIDLLFD